MPWRAKPERPATWNALNNAVFAGAFKPAIGRYRTDFVFRGLGEGTLDLRTTLQRIGANASSMERHLNRSLRKYAHREAAQGDSIWNWLSLGQHHGLPTRLLDWTFSPFVAMHFATADERSIRRDGLVWAVDCRRIKTFLPTQFKRVLKKEGCSVFSAEMLEEIAPTLKRFEEIAGDREFPLFFEPPSLDDRIVNQYALFSAMSKSSVRLDTWLESHSDLVRRIVIRKELKREIRDKLDQMNINERTMFPGLDGLCKWLGRHYGSGHRFTSS